MKKECRRYLKFVKSICHHFQYSVFRGEMTPSKLIKLKQDLNSVIDPLEDFVCIIKLMNEGVFGEEILGKQDRQTGESLIL